MMSINNLIKLDKILKGFIKSNNNIKNYELITNYFYHEDINKDLISRFYKYELNNLESREFYLKNRIRSIEKELKEIKEEKDYLKEILGIFK